MSTFSFLIAIFISSMFVDQQRILDSTNGGLDIILSYYPQAQTCVDNKRKFKTRDEKSASTTLKKLADGTYVVTDFGNDQKTRNAILVCMLEENIEFKQACQLLGTRFNVLPEQLNAEINKPEYESRAAKADEVDGEWYFSVREGFTDLDIKTVLANKVIPYTSKQGIERAIDFEKVQKVFKKYHFYSLESYSVVKNRKVNIFKSTDHYPIMMWDEGSFKKIYQPLSPDAGRRFMYYGKRPKDFLHALDVVKKQWVDVCEPKQEGVTDEAEEETIERPKKLDEVILVSGGSDGMNLAMLGYQVVWPNSETAKLTAKHFKDLSKYAAKVMNLGDIDETGKREAHKLGMEYLEMYSIALPESLLERRDKRGKPCKDVKDYLNFYNYYDFKKLVATALPYQFWGRGYNEKTRKSSYTVKNTRLYNFLAKNGFYRLELENEKNGYIYIRIEGNIVREIKANEVKSFVNEFFEERMVDEDLRDTFYRSTQLNETSLSNLKLTEVDFTDFDRDTQFFFFNNRTVQVTKDEIKEFKPGEVNRFVWDDEVIKHSLKKQEPQFKITKGLDDRMDIEVLKKDNIFFNYLIQTSRIFWRKELEESFEGKPAAEISKYRDKHKFDIAGPNLAPEEIAEQKQHLINKIYSLGYLLHRYKDPSRPWAIFAMDHRISDDGESHGGSGKSIAFKAVRNFMKSVTLDGRKPKLTEDQFIYENVTTHTDYILVDDSNQYLNFQFFFAPLTGELTVNPKNNQRFIIPFQDVPKFALTSNFVVRNLDSSTERRLLYTVFSDYYHQNSNEFYAESRSPRDEFGKNILNEDFTDDEWNDFYNFMMQCCQFYMNHGKIEPPMNNVEKRNLMSIMGVAFHEWADVFFSDTSERRDVFVPKTEAFQDFQRATRAKWTAQHFSKAIKAWSKYYGYELDPKDYHNGQGRIIRSHTVDGKAVATEMLYIKTNNKPLELDDSEDKDDLPF
ncbi:MAG: hypothetical protein JXR07_20370 [Reichenbachiella sp.]